MMVAMSALGTGIDLRGIMHVIHVERLWSLIEYGQESGRAGRGGKKVKATILMSTEEYEELEEKEEEFMREDERWLKRFIITEECRVSVLGEYFDGVEMVVDCDGLKGEKCDNCIDGEGLRAQFKNKWRYEERVRWMEEDVRRESHRTGKVREMLEKLKGRCGCCWVKDGWLESEHKLNECKVLDGH